MLTGVSVSFIVENVNFNFFMLGMPVRKGARRMSKKENKQRKV